MVDMIRGRRPRAIQFTHEGQDITPAQVFELLYAGLDEVIALNIADLGTKRRAPSILGLDIQSLTDEKHDKEIKALGNRWRASEQPNILANVVFDDRSRMPYEVARRYNFQIHGVKKRPSIAYLQSNDRTTILREARRYDLEGLIIPFVKQAPKKSGLAFDVEATKQFYENNPDDHTVTPPTHQKSTVYIPEPQLLHALEFMYAQEGIPRITPEMAAVDKSDDKLWYVRDFKSRIEDTTWNPQALGKHLGVMNALGLMELDRQMIHYCQLEHGIGNYDPDLMLHTRHVNTVQHREWEDIKAELKGSRIAQYLGSEQVKKDIEVMKRAAWDERSELATMGVDQHTLYGYLLKDIRTEAFPLLDLIVE